jgi:hypothetical protein
MAQVAPSEPGSDPRVFESLSAWARIIQDLGPTPDSGPALTEFQQLVARSMTHYREITESLTRDLGAGLLDFDSLHDEDAHG